MLQQLYMIGSRIFYPWSPYPLFWNCCEHGYAHLIHIHVTYYLYLTHCWEPTLIQNQKPPCPERGSISSS